jgi:DNA polymerase III epsilon subunit-like protein
MPNFQKLCMFDLETDGSNPDICSPVQIAAVMIDPIKLTIIPDSEFNINLKPEALETNKEYAYEDSDILDSWHSYPSQETGWKMFVSYLEMYHTRSNGKKSCFTAPIAAGYNINRFDLRIVERLSKKYNNLNKEGKSSLFYPRDVLDIMNLIFYWFEHNNELKNYTLDNLRDYLGISKDGAHDALKDVNDTAAIAIRFLKLHRNLSQKVKFKGSFLNETIGI